ncbi:MAG: hypothetical protein HYR85_00090 [Planctomycetes bacterium]|nr:hypothetical protein [Planctomycetota bacterium]MBI3845928.1 hypothetical protein [Planctomycetota bacterium]
MATQPPEGTADGTKHANPKEPPPEVTPALQAAVRRGVSFLVSQQDRDSGAFGSKDGKIAVTALACLALMANGNTDTGGAYSGNVASALRFLIHSSKRGSDYDGYIVDSNDSLSRMHGHGYATLALAEAYGMFGVGHGMYGGVPLKPSAAASADENTDDHSFTLRDALVRAVQLIERAQSNEGGWYYNPENDGNHEGSVTICMLQALRSARNAGIAVKAETIKNAIGYVKRSQNDDGSFAYSLRERRSSVALTAAALSTLNAIGEYDGPVVKRGMDYLKSNFESSLKTGEWYPYANMYAAQAFFQEPDDRTWKAYFPILREDVLRRQQDNGSWDQPGTKWVSYGAVYTTSCMLLILEIPYRYLPIFQR